MRPLTIDQVPGLIFALDRLAVAGRLVAGKSDSPKSRFIAGECDVLELADELDKSWTKTWTASLNPLR